MVIHLDAGGALAIDLPDERHVRMRVGAMWKRMAADPTRPDHERALARRQIAEAQAFIARLELRREVLRAFAEAAAVRQELYARGEDRRASSRAPRSPAPFAVHESTASRIVAEKVVQLASGGLVPFASFFRGARAAEEALARVVATGERPLSGPAAPGWHFAGLTTDRRSDLLGAQIQSRSFSLGAPLAASGGRTASTFSRRCVPTRGTGARTTVGNAASPTY